MGLSDMPLSNGVNTPLDVMLVKFKNRSPPRAWPASLISSAPRSAFFGSFGSAFWAMADAASSEAAKTTLKSWKMDDDLIPLTNTVGSFVGLFKKECEL